MIKRNFLSKVLVLLLFVMTIAFYSSYAYSWFDDLTNNQSQTLVSGEWMIGISTAQEFYDFATKTDSVTEDRYFLENDIDFTGFTWELDSSNNDVVFRGVLDGDEHTISNLTIFTDNTTYSYLGIFTRIEDGTVKNLVLDNVNVEIDSTAFTSNTYRSGLIAGEATGDVTITNITLIDSSVMSNKGTGAGGIVGYTKLSSTNIVINDIKATNLKIWNYESNAGGIIGQINKNTGSVTVSDIDVEVDIYSNDVAANIGGIVGRIEDGPTVTIENVIVEMSTQNTLVTSLDYLSYSNKHAGGIIGFSSSTNVLLNINNSFITGSLQMTTAKKSRYVGTAIGRNLGTYSTSNSYSAYVEFMHTDGLIYYTPDSDARGEFLNVASESSMPSSTWWNTFATSFDLNLWDQDSTGRLFLIR